MKELRSAIPGTHFWSRYQLVAWREVPGCSPYVVYLRGKRFLLVGGMFASNSIDIFHSDEDLAIPSRLLFFSGAPRTGARTDDISCSLRKIIKTKVVMYRWRP